MKASVKLRRDQEGRVQKTPIVKAKLPFDFLGFPIHAGFKACGQIQELALRLSCAQQEAGPSVEVSYRPHEQDRPFTLSFKTGFSPWPSSPASALTMAAEFNLSRLSNPTFLLRVKPQLGDFSLCHDFRTAIFASASSAPTSNDKENRHGGDESSSDIGFINAFAGYATKLRLSENSSFPWHDAARNEICDAGHRYDATSNANIANFDSTPCASERASFSMFDLVNFRSEYPTPVRISKEERRFRDVVQDASTNTVQGSIRDKLHSRDLTVTPRMDDGWDHAVNGASESITSASSSTLQSRDDDRACVRRRSQSTSSLAGWVSRGFSGSGHLRACTCLPISPEAQFRIRWALNVSSSPSLLPLLLLDKVTLEAAAPSIHTRRTPLLPTFTNALKEETQLEDVTHLEQVDSVALLRAREKNVSEGTSTYAGLQGELNRVHKMCTDMKKPPLFARLLHGKGALD